MNNEEQYFNIIYKLAMKAYKKKEIPVGAIIVYKNKIIAKSYNNRQSKYNVLGHAEIIAIQKAEKKLKDWRLNNCTMYVSLEPCELCEKIINESRIQSTYYLVKGKSSVKSEQIKQTNVCDELKSKYSELLKNFFQKMR